MSRRLALLSTFQPVSVLHRADTLRLVNRLKRLPSVSHTLTYINQLVDPNKLESNQKFKLLNDVSL